MLPEPIPLPVFLSTDSISVEHVAGGNTSERCSVQASNVTAERYGGELVSVRGPGAAVDHAGVAISVPSAIETAMDEVFIGFIFSLPVRLRFLVLVAGVRSHFVVSLPV
jgi:hypothetical protein